jgi:outer membrane protein TolC
MQLIKVRVHAGDAPEWDLIKFQANKVQFQRDLVSAQLNYQQAVLDLLNLLGSQAANILKTTPAAEVAPMPAPLRDSPVEVVGDLAVAPPPISASLEELRQTAIEHRPDVIAARRAVDAARRILDLAYAQRTLNQTRVAANQAHFDYRISLYQLGLATGRRFLEP